MGINDNRWAACGIHGRTECAVCDQKGRIDIPTLCYHSELSIYGPAVCVRWK